ncbi:concanavalin A-like lectin/glucanase domain-containing protein [Irpex rosettiformis]|uniref:Concanavalin A-like lectin/glucanase domain-containing protein n=1 Tax=Irpex rosettiformis TaxID=378272 RepID=A0ACB8U335_9APHY|nr:concanavalin A-like lectin/glucanase domain-containing protein [Irpex rosettiformis]
MRLLQSITWPLVFGSLVHGQYSMVKEYIGEKFFDDWNFYGKVDDLTNGDVFYVDSKQASQTTLATVNAAGNAVMRVDNTSSLTFGDKRNSVRVSSQERYTVGSLWVADILHLPYGCSVWPAWWSSAPNWPDGDTLEGVNQANMAHMGLHTETGCTLSNSSVQTSTLINSTDCSILANNNEGCIVTNPNTTSYGPAFASSGGGIFVTEFAAKGISIWFFPRSLIPNSLQGNQSSIDTSTLGTPVANWPASGCNVNQFFEPQELVFDITLCGDYAGNQATFLQTCSGICYDDWVLGNPSNFDTAYFEVQYVRVYGIPGQLTVISGAHRSADFAALLTLVITAVSVFILLT